MILRQPALNIRVMNGATAISGKPVTAQPTTGDCAPGLKFKLVSYTGTGTGDANRGWASKNVNAAAGGYDPGLPYGVYDVCVDNGVSPPPAAPTASSRRSRAGSVIVNNTLAAGSAQRTVDLGVAAQYTSGQLCPL